MTAELAMLHTAQLETHRPMSAMEIRAGVNLIQEVMKSVMKKDVHFGTIPGTPKPTLYKAGAEKILSTFRIAIDPVVEDLSIPDEARFRVACKATSQVSGLALGSGVGECSSNEEKYKWRRIVHIKEWDATPEDRRRVKFTQKGEETRQVRTQPADVANTVLKMAVKRAMIAVTLTVTAASDIFAQDIEDLPEEIRESVLVEDDGQGQPHIPEPQRKSAAKPATVVNADAGKLFVKEAKFFKEGETNGKAWSLYRITLSDGHEYSTFSESVYKDAYHASQNGLPVTIDWEPGKKDGQRSLKSLTLIEGPEA